MLRLRPVLMTTVATIAGNFPLTLVTGAGAAARNSIGIMLVSGMTIGTLFTLLVVPSIYMLIAKDHARRKFPRRKHEFCYEWKSANAGSRRANQPDRQTHRAARNRRNKIRALDMRN